MIMRSDYSTTLALDGVAPVETLQQAFTLFRTMEMPARNLAAFTRKAYTDDITDALRFLAARGVTQISHLTLNYLKAFQAEMDKRGYATSTRNRKTQAIRIFCQFLHRQGLTYQNIAAELIPPAIQRPEPRFLSETEYQRLLGACGHNLRDTAMIQLFLQTGMRLAELTRLTLDDIEIPKRITPDPENTGIVQIRRKGGKVATIPLNWKACRAVAAWLQLRPITDSPALFLSKFEKPMSTRAVEYMLTKYLKEARIVGASVHTLRHTMATHHVARGTDLKTVQETLGHASLDTTTIYVSLAKRAQRKALQEHAL